MSHTPTFRLTGDDTLPYVAFVLVLGDLSRAQREPGGNPGLPRSGKRERGPRIALTLRGWEAVGSRNPASEPESSPARRPASIRRRDKSGDGSTWAPRGRREGPT